MTDNVLHTNATGTPGTIHTDALGDALTVPTPVYGGVATGIPVETREEEWTIDVLDRTDKIKHPLTHFVTGTLEQNRDRAVRGGGTVTLQWAQGEDIGIDWSSDRLAIRYTLNGQSWPMGVFLISTPRVDYDDDTGTATAEVTLLDKLTVLDQDRLDGSYAIPAGTNVANAIRSVIASTGETAVTISDDTRTTSGSLAWEADTSKLTVVNDLLDVINFQPLRCDGNGVYRSGPYVAPNRRPIKRIMREGEDSLHVPTWTREQDWYSIPNKVVMISAAGTDNATTGTPSESFRSVATNTDPESPYSYQRRGRWIVSTIKDVEVANQATLDELAQMQLGLQTSRVSNLTVTHAMIPELELEDRLQLETRNHTADVWIRTYSVTMEPGALVTGGWRELSFA